MDSWALAFVGRLGLGRRRRLVLALRRSPGWVGRPSGGIAGFNLAAVLQLVLAVNDHGVTRLESLADAHGVTRRKGQRDLLDFHGMVWQRQIDVGALRPALDGRRRNDGDVTFGVHQKMNIYELVGEENIVFVAEDGLQLIGTGGGVDLVVDGKELAGGNLVGVVAVVGVD